MRAPKSKQGVARVTSGILARDRISVADVHDLQVKKALKLPHQERLIHSKCFEISAFTHLGDLAILVRAEEIPEGTLSLWEHFITLHFGETRQQVNNVLPSLTFDD